LGAAFAVVIALLAVITVVATTSVGSLQQDVQHLSSGDSGRATRAAGDIESNTQELGHRLAQHLYVYDGDLANQDRVAKEVDRLERSISADLDTLGRLVTAPDGRRAVQAAGAVNRRFQALASRDVALSRRETVQGVEERDGSRNLYTGEILPQMPRVEKAFEAVQAAVAAQSAAKVRAAAANIQRTADGAGADARLILIIAIAAALIAAALAWLVTRSVTRPVAVVGRRLRELRDGGLHELDRGLRALAGGDLTVPAASDCRPIESTARDEIGELSRTFDAMLGSADGAIAAYNETRGELSAMLGRVSASASAVSAASEQVAGTSDEAGRAVSEIAGAIGEVAHGTTQQVHAVEATRASTQETERVTREATEIARRGAAASGEASDAMDAVRVSTDEVTGAIRSLAAKSDEIGAIVGTITGIAEQTNLLALNAAIEAARAGDSGRGFAVVAEEVRKLAEESQEAAGSIAALVDRIQAETTAAVERVDDAAERSAAGAAVVAQARDAFAQISAAVAEVGERVAAISAATNEVATVAEQSSASAEQVSASTQETSASTQEIAASAQELARTAEELEGLVQRFRLEQA